MEQGAAPAGAGLTWLCALGRLWGTARRALRPGREELADARGNSPPRSAARNRLNAAAGAPRGVASFTKGRARRDRSARQRIAPGVNIEGAPLGAPPPSFAARGIGKTGVPGALQTIRSMTHVCLIIESDVEGFSSPLSSRTAKRSEPIRDPSTPAVMRTAAILTSLYFSTGSPRSRLSRLPALRPG
jgi:hypothetical protein